jgi:hypothetical protein
VLHIPVIKENWSSSVDHFKLISCTGTGINLFSLNLYDGPVPVPVHSNVQLSFFNVIKSQFYIPSSIDTALSG